MKMRAVLNKILYIRLGRHLKISIGFPALLVCSYICGFLEIFAVSYISAALHEAAHILTAKRLGVTVSRVEVMPFGISAKLSDSIIKNPTSEILIASAGPAFSLTAAAAIFAVQRCFYFAGAAEHLKYAAEINAALCAVNLIPALPLDGGRIFKASLSKFCGTVRAYNTSLKLSRVLIFLILGAAVFLLLTSDFNFSLILIGVFMLGNLSYEHRAINAAAVKEFICSESKIDGKAVNITSVAVRGKTPARLILKKINFSRYYVAVVMDESTKIKKAVTESEIINALVEKGVLITMDEV